MRCLPARSRIGVEPRPVAGGNKATASPARDGSGMCRSA